MLRAQYVEDRDVSSVSLFEKLQGRIGDGRELQIGRGLDSDIVLNSRKVPFLISRRHAILSRRGSLLFLQDLKSVNGTFVNDVQLKENESRALREGDLLSFGGASMLRQAHLHYDEPNPFLFKLTELPRLFANTLPRAVPDIKQCSTQPSSSSAANREVVIDLTADDPPVGPSCSRFPLPQPKKRTKGGHMVPGPLIALDDDDDFDMMMDGLVPERRKKQQQFLEVPPPPPIDGVGPLIGEAVAPKKDDSAAAMLKALEEQFECTICREFMVAPHSLVPCGHMFCGECSAEWILRKQSCPTCRATIEAAPVPSLTISNMLEEVVAPQLDEDAKKERERRKESWAAQNKKLTQKLQQLFSRRIGMPPPPHPSQSGLFSQFGPVMGLHGIMELTFGNFPMGRGPPNIRRARTARRGNAGAQPPPHPPNPEPAAPPHPGPFSFAMVQRNTNRRTCNACGGPFLAPQTYIREGASRGYHLHCDARAPGFLNAWTASGGILPGTHLLSSYELGRLRAHLNGPVGGPGSRRGSRR